MDKGFKKLELPSKLTPKAWVVKNIIVVLNILFILALAVLAFIVIVFITNGLASASGGSAYLNILSLFFGSLIFWITGKRIATTKQKWTRERYRVLTIIYQKIVEEWVNYNYIFNINVFEAKELMSSNTGENIISFSQLKIKPDFYIFGSIRKKQVNKNWIEITLAWQYNKFILVYKNKSYKEVEHKKHSYEE